MEVGVHEGDFHWRGAIAHFNLTMLGLGLLRVMVVDVLRKPQAPISPDCVFWWAASSPAAPTPPSLAQEFSEGPDEHLSPLPDYLPVTMVTSASIDV